MTSNSLARFITAVSSPLALQADVVGRKAALFAHMAARGVPIPETFLFLPQALHSRETNTVSWQDAHQQILEALSGFEEATEMRLGASKDPLLLAARLSCDLVLSSDSALLNLGLPLSGSVIVRDRLMSDQDLANEQLRLKGQLNGLLSEQPDSVPPLPEAVDVLEQFILRLIRHRSHQTHESNNESRGACSVIVQVMHPSTLAPDNVTMTIFSSDPTGSVSGPLGYIEQHGTVVVPSYSLIEVLRQRSPQHYEAVFAYCRIIEEICGNICRIRFGLDQGKLYVLGVHIARALPEAAAELLVQQVQGGKRKIADAVRLAEPKWFQVAGSDRIANPTRLIPIGRGVSLGERCVTGRVATNPDTVNLFASKNEPCIFVSDDLKFGDAHVLAKTTGIVSIRGGTTSHMSVVAHGMGKICITSIQGSSVLPDKRQWAIGGTIISEGDWVTVDEAQGIIYSGRGELMADTPKTSLRTLLRWAQTSKQIGVLVNADTLAQVQEGLRIGADGVGLCRTEHQLLETTILHAFRCMLLCSNSQEQNKYTQVVMEALTSELVSILRGLNGKPIHYRLLDPPINEFLPKELETIPSLAQTLGISTVEIEERVDRLREENSLLGRRGCRWGLSFPEFYRQQIWSAVQSAKQVVSEGVPVELTVIIPMVSMISELRYWWDIYRQALASLLQDQASQPHIEYGVMVETPRAALLAAELAEYAPTLCLGTNDLTQATFAISRDDYGDYLPLYQQYGLVYHDIFKEIDRDGVGKLINLAIHQTREARSDARWYACGEHAGEHTSIQWFAQNHIDGVSCTVGRVQPAIITAAQAALASDGQSALGYHLPSADTVSLNSQEVLQALVGKLAQGARGGAIELAYQWAHEVELRAGLQTTNVWKFFKRNLVTRWFNPREHKRLLPGWTTDEALEYASSLHDSTVRYSIFPRDIAAQSVSEVLPSDHPVDVWREILDRLDHSVAVEIFPQQPETKLSFRAVLKDFVLHIEAGFGQAINVFWRERGSHAVVTGAFDTRSYRVTLDSPAQEGDPVATSRLRSAVEELLARYGNSLAASCLDMSLVLGVEWVAIEAYYEGFKGDPPFVADVDIPLDLAFYR